MKAGTFHGKSQQDPYDWFFALDFFFEVALNLRDPTSRVAFAATPLRDDALKCWRQAKTSGTAEEHDFDRLKAQCCSGFLTTNSVIDLSSAESLDQCLRDLRSMSGDKSCSRSLRIVKIPCGLLRFTTLQCLASLTRNTTRSLEKNSHELQTPPEMP